MIEPFDSNQSNTFESIKSGLDITPPKTFLLEN